MASRRSVVWVVLACAAVPMLVAGCGESGFHPLYASSSLVGSDVNAADNAYAHTFGHTYRDSDCYSNSHTDANSDAYDHS